nr:Uncharacterised protein [Klebsiella pneumoniae]
MQRRLRGGEVHDQHGPGEALILFIDHHRESISPLDDGKRAPRLLQDAVQLKAEIASHHGKSGDKACAVHRQPGRASVVSVFCSVGCARKAATLLHPVRGRLCSSCCASCSVRSPGKRATSRAAWEGRRVLTLTCSASSGWTQTKGSRR